MKTKKVSDDATNINFEIMDNLRTGVIVLDEFNDYIYLNVSAKDILGSANIIKKIDNISCKEIHLNNYINNVRTNDGKKEMTKID